jgi:hypothetical protein
MGNNFQGISIHGSISEYTITSSGLNSEGQDRSAADISNQASQQPPATPPLPSSGSTANKASTRPSSSSPVISYPIQAPSTPSPACHHQSPLHQHQGNACHTNTHAWTLCIPQETRTWLFDQLPLPIKLPHIFILAGCQERLAIMTRTKKWAEETRYKGQATKTTSTYDGEQEDEETRDCMIMVGD